MILPILLLACGGKSEPAPIEGDFSIFYSHSVAGEIEPCGSPKNPMGGLPRRASVIEQARQESSVAVVDGGDLFWRGGALSDLRLSQQREKARLMAENMSSLGWDAWVPGESDWTLGVEFLQGLIRSYSLPVLAGNLRCGDTQYPGHRLVERDGRRIGFVGVVDYTLDGCVVEDPVEAAQEAIDALAEPDVVVAVFHGSAQLDGNVLGAVDGIDFFLNGHSGRSMANPKKVHDAFFVGSGPKGKKIGRLDLYWKSGNGPWIPQGEEGVVETRIERYRVIVERTQKSLEEATKKNVIERLEKRSKHYKEQIATLEKEIQSKNQSSSSRRFRNHLVSLDAQVADHPATKKMLEDSKERIGVLAKASAGTSRVDHLPFLGSETCRACHVPQYEQWKATPHASAYATLVADKRAMDSECFACHVTGAHHPKGPQLPTSVGLLKDVGCESCHGPGQAHLAQPVGTMQAVAAEDSCVDCHDGIKDEGRFDPATYLPKVRH